MDLSKLPPFVAMSLGLLSCTTVDVCLSLGGPESDTTTVGDTATDTGTGTGTSSGGPETVTGPCLGAPMETETMADSTGSGSDSGTGTDSGSGSGSDSGSGTDSGTDGGSSSGGMGDEPPPTRAAAVQRVLERGSLPTDVLERLRTAVLGPKG